MEIVNKRERCHFIDVAKGILILLVVLHHQPMIDKENGIENTFLLCLGNASSYYNAFFMPAFFVITGYCTNFYSKSISHFFVHQVLSIMLPAFCLGALSVWLHLIGEGCADPIEYCKIGFKTFVISGGAFWFLPALLISKMLYHIWLHILSCFKSKNDQVKNLLTFCFCIFLHALGCVCEEHGLYNFWYYQHALALTIFIFCGQMLKRRNKMNILYLTSSLVYIFMLTLFQTKGIEHPYITHGFRTSVDCIPQYLVLASSGSFMVIYISKLLEKNIFLEYFGKNSIIVYCLHLPVLFSIQNLSKLMIGTEIVSTDFFAIVQLGLCLFVLAVLIRILNTKRLQILQGKLPWKIV